METGNNSRITIWQLVILVLCVYVIAVMGIEAIFQIPEPTKILLKTIDNMVCMVFIGDFFYRLIVAKSKLEYLKWGWIDLISSIPSFQMLRWGRSVRIFRILRVLRTIRSAKYLIKFLFANRAKGAFASVAVISFIVIVVGAVSILNCETATESNIKSPSDALWWSFVTVTTVGYGDYYPVTSLGRIVAAILMATGVGLLGTFTAFIASLFMEQQQDVAHDNIKSLTDEIRELKSEIEKIKDKLS